MSSWDKFEMRKTYMDGQCHNRFQLEDLDGLVKRELAKCTDKDYLLEVDVAYPEQLHDLHNDLPFMCERMEINHVEKLVPKLYDK